MNDELLCRMAARLFITHNPYIILYIPDLALYTLILHTLRFIS